MMMTEEDGKMDKNEIENEIKEMTKVVMQENNIPKGKKILNNIMSAKLSNRLDDEEIRIGSKIFK